VLTRLYRHGFTVVPRLFALAIVASLVGAALAIATPILAGQAIGGVPAFLESGPTTPFVLLVVLLLVVLLLANLTGVAEDAAQRLMDGYLQSDTVLRIGHALSVDPDLGTLDDPEVAAKVAKVRARFWEIGMGLRMVSGPMLTSVVTAIGSAVTLAVLLDWWAPLPLLAMYVVEAERFRRVITRQFDLWTGQVEGQKHAMYAFKQGMGAAAKEVRIFGLSSYLRERFDRNMRMVYLPYWRKRNSQSAVNVLVNITRVLVTVGVLAWAGWRASNGDLGLAALATCLPVILSLGSTDAWMFGQIQRASEEVQWLYDLTDGTHYPGAAVFTGGRAAVQVRDRVEQPETPASGPASVVFDEVSFHYPRQDTLILDGLTLELPVGAATALVGINGAGKSTLVKLLAGGYLPTRGTIWVDGVDLATLDPDGRRAWQRRVAPITQDFIRMPLPAGDNVELGRGAVWAGGITVDPLPASDDLDRIAQRAGITDLVQRLPHGWGTVLDKTIPGGTDLSGGEWQRIGLARALRAVEAGAGVLVLDEPAAALDVRSEARLVDGYLDLAQHVTSLIISHRFSVVRPVPIICVLSGGSIVEQGSHEELMTVPDGRYRQMFTLQASRYVAEESADDLTEEVAP